MITGVLFKGKRPQVKTKISLAEAQKWIRCKQHSWIDVSGYNETELKKILKLVFPDYYSLIQEDIQEDSRPKLEFYENFSFMIFKGYTKKKRFDRYQVSMILGKNFILTFQKNKDLKMEKVRDYFKTVPSTVDFVLYKVLELLFEDYYDVLENVYNKLEKFEKQSLRNPKPKLLQEIMELKRQMLSFRRILTYEREILIPLSRGDTDYIKKRTSVFMRDVYDDAVHLIDREESMRDVLSSNIEIYLSSVNNKANEIMKVLTVVASFVLIPTLISGIYGMNFRVMPEIPWVYGYPFALGLMGLSVLLMFLLFRKKGWM